MAGKKITQLPFAFAALLTDVLPEVQGGITKQINLQQILNLYNANIQIAESQVTNLVTDLASKLNLSGGTMTGALNMGGFRINNLQDPGLPQDGCTKAYADSIAGGFTPIPGVVAASTVTLTATYSNGASGVGATLTNSGAQAAFAIDGYTASLNDRILIKNQSSTFQNGIYTVTTLGSVSTNWVLTRANDYNQPSEITPGNLVAVQNGTVNEGSSWLETAAVTTIGTDPILFSPFFLPAEFMMRANNLSDVASVPSSLVNLGLGTPTGTGNVVLNSSPSITTPHITTGISDANGLPIIGLTATASAVNEINIANSATTFPVILSAIGSDTNISVLLNSKGTGGVQVKGVTDGSTAPAGYLGEFVTSQVLASAPISPSSNTPINVTSISLTAGNWIIFGNVTLTFSGLSTDVRGWISTVSATIQDVSTIAITTYASTTGLTKGLSVPCKRLSITSTTTVYLTCQATFTTGVCQGSGGIFALRL